MILCSDGHLEVCYGNIVCPVCEMTDERDELKSKLIDLESGTEQMHITITDLEEEIDALKSESLQFKSLIADLENKVDKLEVVK